MLCLRPTRCAASKGRGIIESFLQGNPHWKFIKKIGHEYDMIIINRVGKNTYE